MKATGPAGGQAPSNQIPTHGVEAQNEQLQPNQQRTFSPTTVNVEHEHSDQNQSLLTSGDNQENSAVLDQGFIDPRMFSSNHDPRMFAKKSP